MNVIVLILATVVAVLLNFFLMNNTKKLRKKAEDRSLELKKVHEVWGPVEAQVTKSFLESHGISCVLKGLVVQSVHAFSADGLGKIDIFVAEKDFELAKKLLLEK